MDAVVDLTQEAEQEDGGAGAAHAGTDQGSEEARVQQALAVCAEELQSVEDSLLALSARRDALRRKREELAEQVSGGDGRRQVNNSASARPPARLRPTHRGAHVGCTTIYMRDVHA
jgi:hypothetical protein